MRIQRLDCSWPMPANLIMHSKELICLKITMTRRKVIGFSFSPRQSGWAAPPSWPWASICQALTKDPELLLVGLARGAWLVSRKSWNQRSRFHSYVLEGSHEVRFCCAGLPVSTPLTIGKSETASLVENPGSGGSVLPRAAQICKSHRHRSRGGSSALYDKYRTMSPAPSCSAVFEDRSALPT